MEANQGKPHLPWGVRTLIELVDLRAVATAALIALFGLAALTYWTVHDMYRDQKQVIVPTLNEHQEKLNVLWEERIRRDERAKVLRSLNKEEQP